MLLLELTFVLCLEGERDGVGGGESGRDVSTVGREREVCSC